jgi:hypothetical protein
MLALDADYMRMVLAATIEAIFIVMGKPDVKVRQCPLAMDKWSELVIGKTDHVGIHHRPQQTHSCHPSEIPSGGS